LVYVSNIQDTRTEDVHMDGVFDTKIQWLIDEHAGAKNFAMRRFRLAPGGIINLHTHDWEHEVYILEGRGEVLTEEKKYPVEPGSVVYVEPAIPDGFKNRGESEFVFLCMIPIKEG
jgi:quercetin dioxygenase-like cupin family protein